MAQPSPAIRQRLAQLKAEAMIRAERDAQRQKAIQNAEKAAGQPVGLPMDKKAKGGLAHMSDGGAAKLTKSVGMPAGVKHLSFEDYTPDEVELVNLETHEKGKMHGTNAMQKIVNKADEHKINLMLIPAGNKSKRERLKNFYGRFDFYEDGDVLRRSHKAKGGSVWNSPDWKPHPENDLLQPIGASKMVGDERLLSQDDTFSHGLSEFPSSKKSYRYLYHGEDKKPIGAMQIQTSGPRSKKAVIQNLYVAEANRRQGIASKLLERARQDFDVKHSTDLTSAGRAFAKAVKASGGSIPSQDVMRLAIGGQGPRNFLKGSVEKVTEPLMSKGITEADRAWLEQHGRQNPEALRIGLEAIPRTEAINQWIQRNLANYIRKQMGHPNDPLRKLAEEGVLHFDPERLGVHEEIAKHRREMLGGEKMAKSPLAQAWENAVDTRFEPNTVEDVRNMPDIYKGMYEPWMEKADPKTNLYELYGANELGFDHIVDILKQDLAEGRIRPEQLNKVSMEQAVRRVHEYDQAQKKKMAETALKATEGMPVHKDYGNGFKWIELAMPDPGTEVPDTHELEQYNSNVHGTGYRYVNKQTGMKGEGFKTPERATEEFLKSQAEDKLDKALKYEGDTMGHCVGGYTPDVASGKSRIFSLRDEKNEPHVTVEVKPEKNPYLSTSGNISDEGLQKIRRMFPDSNFDLEYGNWFKSTGQHSMHFAQKYAPWIKENYPEIYEATIGAPLEHKIKQIKGKGNAKPVKNYMPFVHDFVRSSNMEVVGDLDHTDLRKVGNKYLTDDELDAISKQHLGTVINNPARYYSDMKRKDPSAISEADQNYINALENFQYPPHMADGGEVDAEEIFMAKGGKVKELEQYLRQREGEYGVKRLQRAADEIPGLEKMYTLQALKEAFGGDNAKALMTMDPALFQLFAHKLEMKSKQSNYPSLEDRKKQGDLYKEDLPTEEYIKHLAGIQGGFADVPFLEVERRKPEYLPSIEGHEGRHRQRALASKGIKKSLVQLFPTPSMRERMPRRYREDFIEAMKKELGEKRLITPEGRSLLPADLTAQEHRNLENRNLVASNRPQLPEIYKDGGEVDAESAFFPKNKE